MTFPIGPIGDIEWNDQAFERLVLPNDHKDLILALIESQVANKDQFDDVIQGKGALSYEPWSVNLCHDSVLRKSIGKGMIMLLSGPPGVGKTLTAESGNHPPIKASATRLTEMIQCRRTYARHFI